MRRFTVRKCEICGKRRYATREAAELALAMFQLKRAGKGEQRAYLDHDWWHLTSQEPIAPGSPVPRR